MRYLKEFNKMEEHKHATDEIYIIKRQGIVVGDEKNKYLGDIVEIPANI